tara:strand:- start:75 stop:737 length:663 start_codon:yes stop_codon:yes gene_type:complete
MKKELEKRILSSVFIIPISLFFVLQGSVFFLFFLGILFLVTSYEWIKMIKKNQLIKTIGIMFLFFSFYSAYQLRNYLELTVGLNVFLFIILICIFTDIGGYVFGKVFKGPKLTTISPNKTYSGLLGSFIFPVIVSLIYNKYYTLTGTYFSSKLPGVNFELNFLFFILFISMISQLGDLIISFFKRKAKVKDTGKLLPGHGGLLDRIDGLIFVIPILYLTL